MIETFYATLAQICFALLGLWWVVVQFKYDAFMRNPSRRRTAYSISSYFILPGIMGLIAILSTNLLILWRVTFVIAGLLGALETIYMLISGEGQRGAQIARVITLILYFLIVLFAFSPEMPNLLGAGVKPLEVEGVLSALMVLLGVNLAWFFFAELKIEA